MKKCACTGVCTARWLSFFGCVGQEWYHMVVLYLVVLKNHMLAKIIKKACVCSIWVCTGFCVWGEHACVCMFGDLRWMSSICPCYSPPYLEMGSLTEPGAHRLSQWTLGICLFSAPQFPSARVTGGHHFCQLWCVCWDPNSGSHIYTTNTLLTEQSPQSSYSLVLFFWFLVIGSCYVALASVECIM